MLTKVITRCPEYLQEHEQLIGGVLELALTMLDDTCVAVRTTYAMVRAYMDVSEVSALGPLQPGRRRFS